jgi:hypothetical protein
MFLFKASYASATVKLLLMKNCREGDAGIPLTLLSADDAV